MLSQEKILSIGVDVGSTTVKVVVIDAKGNILFSVYQRHMSEVREKMISILEDIAQRFPNTRFNIAMTGSGALVLCKALNLPFVQEVIASSISIKNKIPQADVVVELGGEDAKLMFLSNGTDLRMNETCAGGTGAFIDQMASFLSVETTQMDALACEAKTIYPIASRCGVFAKTDIVPLINEGCEKKDIALSIMQAVVNQFIGGLARGRKITGTVVFLGGPLAFLKSLRRCFVETLKLTQDKAIFPDKAEIFVALGAALYTLTVNSDPHDLNHVVAKFKAMSEEGNIQKLPALFANKQEYEAFKQRHSQSNEKRFPLEEYEGPAWLGIDSGSTTLKAVLIDDQNRVLYSHYGPNKGEPFTLACQILSEIYARKKPGLVIQAAAATGYGSALLKAGLKLDIDEVETVAHCTASTFFAPKATFVLDIGGQDIKCMSLRDGVIERIGLNEACSAGCGSFIENFAKSLHMELPEFVQAALTAKHPVDLGTRCTVFMNSKVKQAQKEGVKVGDIAAGLSYSVIKNACYKVIKIHDVSELGDCIVAQGGSFLNDALLRALEIQVGKPVIRPGLAGLMGAFGAALLARKRGPENGLRTQLLSSEEIKALNPITRNIRCQGCTNHCMLTITKFGESQFVSGNRCERGAGRSKNKHINLVTYKYERLFNYYKPLTKKQAKRGTVGIPRALGIFENYPFWFTLLHELGFRVELSEPSSKKLFFNGYASIPSQTVCYPAKLAHGHVMDLLEKGVDAIFFPSINREEKLFAEQVDHFNCPIVSGYPEVLAKNISEIADKQIPFYTPFLPLDRHLLPKRLQKVPLFKGCSKRALEKAVHKAAAEQEKFTKDVQREGERALEVLAKTGQLGIVLAGHPYHIDPTINHGIPELVNACGAAVLTEDAIAHLATEMPPLHVRNQWTYHARLYRASAFVAKSQNLSILHLVSFGCGIDAISAEEMDRIVRNSGRLYAQIKIDEGDNLGPAKIRIRSLLAAMKDQNQDKPANASSSFARFTAEMKKTHTILIPQMSPMHFQFMESIFEKEGYRVVQLPTVSKAAVELGLKHVNNDICYPAIVTIGQLLQAIQQQNLDTHKVALLLSQTNGGCRASNYVWLMRRALEQCNLSYIPVMTFDVSNRDKNTGFSPSLNMWLRLLMMGVYGDTLLKVVHRVRPYEKIEGSTKQLEAKWVEKIKKNLKNGNLFVFFWNVISLIHDFDKMPLKRSKRRPRVGIVGEILLKYHPDANNHVVNVIEQEGGEAVISGLMEFMLYACYDKIFSHRYLEGSLKSSLLSRLGIFLLESFRLPLRIGCYFSKRFHAPVFFKTLRRNVRDIVSLGQQTGEGWLLPAEEVQMIKEGVHNIICVQPFGCLPNHIIAKGSIQPIKKRFPAANIIAIDYDPGTSETNQVNRIKLMMSVAKQQASVTTKTAA